MEAGLTVFNDNNIIQIDQNYINQRAPTQRLIVGQTNNDFYDLSAFNVDMRVECPIVFVRSSGFVGNFQLVPTNSSGSNYPRGSMQFYCETTTEIAVCSSNLQPTRGKFGLEVFGPDGKFVYGSLDKYPQIFHMAQLNGSAVVSSTAVPNSDSSSWWCINPITPGLSRPLGAGSDMSYPPYTLMGRLSGGTMTVKFQENGSPTGQPNAQNTSLSPWNGRTIRIPVARIYY